MSRTSETQPAVTPATLDELDAERRNAAAAQEAAERASVHASWVTFRVAGQWLAVDATHVEEICDQAGVHAIPHAPKHIPGIINVRGHAVPLLDIERFLDLHGEDADTERPSDERARKRVILTHAGDMQVGLLCEQVRSIDHLEGNSLQQPIGLDGLKLGGFARLQADMSPGVVTLLDLPKLLEAARVQR
jgi:purine-binding chemotaxis protein CheW